MNSLINKIYKNTRGGTVILLSVLILASVLTVSLTVGNIVKNGLLTSRTQVYSTKAFFASEAGAERILWEIRNKVPRYEIEDSANCDVNVAGKLICFDGSDNIASCGMSCGMGNTSTTTLSNTAIFVLSYANETSGLNSTTTISSVGEYRGTKRKTELKY